jgi:hypothetical protein
VARIAFAADAAGSWPDCAGHKLSYRRPASQPPPLPALDQALNFVKAALAVFYDSARIIRWPLKTSLKRLCLAWFWTRLPDRTDMTDKKLNAIFKASEVFGDHVLLWRCLIEHDMATRTVDGATYRRRGRSPDPEERAVIRALSERPLSTA